MTPVGIIRGCPFKNQQLWLGGAGPTIEKASAKLVRTGGFHRPNLACGTTRTGDNEVEFLHDDREVTVI
jgi:hypothetical protein